MATAVLLFSGVMLNGKKVAWILGSGFSKSLGGPLLKDLLSHSGEAYTRTKFPELSRKIYSWYRTYLKGDPASHGKPIYWEHAEEFLDFISSATLADGPDRYDILVRLLGLASKRDASPYEDHLESIRQQAICCLASECLFTTHSSTRSEAWRPYLKWAGRLPGGDTIITFNYDMVLEKLAANYVPQMTERYFGTVVPPSGADIAELDELNVVKILKLHGSVGWHTFGKAFGTAASDVEAAEKLRENAIPFIVGPGPEKLLHQEGTFKKLWALAERALIGADVIVFLGYRFPPSDSQSRSVVLEAIRSNRKSNVRVHIVLGPRKDDDDSVRLRELLKHTLEERRGLRDGRTGPTYELLPHALLVEDFLTVQNSMLLYGES